MPKAEFVDSLLLFLIDLVEWPKCYVSRFLFKPQEQLLTSSSAIIAENGGSIKEVQHDRILLTAFVYKVALICTIETRCDKHATLIHEKLEEKYKKDLTWHTVSAQYYGEPDPELVNQSSDPNIP